MPKFIIVRGLPGSGKTTRAEAWVAGNPGRRARVNRDDLRAMAHNGVVLMPLDREDGTEVAIRALRDSSITILLALGRDVVCDDVNLDDPTVARLLEIADEVGADVEVWDLTDVPLEECLRRNAARDKQIPEMRIIERHHAYIAGRGYPLPMPGGQR